MRRITPNTQRPRKWALALRREMQMAVGLQLQVECEPPQELPPELTAIHRSYLSSVFVSGGNISTFVITSLTNFASAGNRGNDSNHALHFGQRQT
jgi:hypothetical protein